MEKVETLAQVPPEWYPVIGFLVVSNIGLVGSAITVVIKHLSQFMVMQTTLNNIERDVIKLKQDVDAAHARLRDMHKP